MKTITGDTNKKRYCIGCQIAFISAEVIDGEHGKIDG